MALLGSADLLSRSKVLGWAFDPDQPNSTLQIAILLNGLTVGHCFAEHERAGLKDYIGGEATGCHEFRFSFEPPLSVFKEWQVEVQVVGHDTTIENHHQVLPAPSSNGAAMIPVILTSTGRSGTTLLMSELVQHPQIVAANLHPYEIKLISYYSSAFRALVSNEDRVRSTNPDMMFEGPELYRIGHNPYNNPLFYSLVQNKTLLERLFEKKIPNMFAKLFREIILEYYTILKHDSMKFSASFFAEKGDVDETVRQGARMMFGRVRELVLLRDPRDLLCSAMAFWKMPFTEALEMLTTTVRRLHSIRQTADADTHFLRYEDLITAPQLSRDKMYQFIGVDPAFRPASNEAGVFDGHGTSRDPKSSVARWREDLSAADVTACEELFSDYMDIFGYERTSHTRTRQQLDVVQGAGALERMKHAPSDASSKHLAPMTEIGSFDFNEGSDGCSLLGGGWSVPESDGVWSDGGISEVLIPCFGGKAKRLRLIVRPYLVAGRIHQQRIEFTLDGECLGSAIIDRFAVIEFTVPRMEDYRKAHHRLVIHISEPNRPSDFDPDDADHRLLGLRLHQLFIYEIASGFSPQRVITRDFTQSKKHQDSHMGSAVEIDLLASSKILDMFESLGENCEFGLVQRRVGIERAGLLRFASAPYEKLLAALRKRFARVGDPDMVQVEVSSNGTEYMVLDRAFGFYSHAWVLVGEMDQRELQEKQIKQMSEMARNMITTLENGDKICVFHGMEPLQEVQMRAMQNALREYGPSSLLWVELADQSNPPGTVLSLGKGLLKGYIDRFAPGDDAHNFSLEMWIVLCRRALALRERANSGWR